MAKTTDYVTGKVLSGRVYPEIMPIAAHEYVLNIGSGYGPQAFVYDGQYACMMGTEIQEERARQSRILTQEAQINGFTPLCADAEILPFADASFDKALAIDIIEHVRDPERLCAEARRILKPNGEVLITVPALHDAYTEAFSWVGRHLLRRKSQSSSFAQPQDWHPDAHNQAMSVAEWIRLIEGTGLELVRGRASTLFPPLHLYGIPRFWFSNDAIHAVDRALCQLPGLKRCGQAFMGVYRRR